MYNATYSPDDNKLRLYASSRLPKDLYDRVKTAGFSWAPKQELFVAPRWTPEAEDLLLELAGEIEDEDKSLVDRAEERADRFDGYSDKRAAEAQKAKDSVDSIMNGIPLGQPILVGHHSEKHARKDAERIENGLRKSVKLWETSKYWTRRAAGALRHAKYKELPGVRARRIKTIEADQRKAQRGRDSSEAALKLWTNIHEPSSLKRKDGKETTMLERCLFLTNVERAGGITLPNGEYYWSAWSALDSGKITPEEVQRQRLQSLPGVIASHERWLAHYANRLAYEKAMLEEQGASHMLEKKPRPKQLPLCNYRAPEGIRCGRTQWGAGEDTVAQIEMTQAEYAKIGDDYKGTRVVDNSHRVRIAVVRGKYSTVFLTDSKVHERPAAKDAPVVELRGGREYVRDVDVGRERKESKEFDALRDQLKAGVKVVSAPQLFPTPTDLARRMVQLAAGPAGMAGKRVLEPSAGTGNLVRAILDSATGADCVRIVAIEINLQLARGLMERRNLTLYAQEKNFKVVCADFLSCTPEGYTGDLQGQTTEPNGKFDCVVMNPPFANAQDVAHIKHAIRFLNPKGGRLVAICANGSRQQKELRPLVEQFAGTWEELPADTFKEAGTGVRTVLLSIDLNG